MNSEVVRQIQNYCGFCGGTLQHDQFPRGLVCATCGSVFHIGPKLLVISLVFAENKILLMKRGLPPYVGRWAPPGGYVESNESLEMAAVREVAEEVGIELEASRLIPHAIVSLPSINQVYVGFLAILGRMRVLRPSPPEALDARWFSLAEWPSDHMWAPASRFNIAQLFEQVRTGEFQFYQWTGDDIRFFGPVSREPQ